jgi:hypothetical protein
MILGYRWTLAESLEGRSEKDILSRRFCGRFPRRLVARLDVTGALVGLTDRTFTEGGFRLTEDATTQEPCARISLDFASRHGRTL